MKQKGTLAPHKEPCSNHDRMVMEKEKLLGDIRLLSSHNLPAPKALSRLAKISAHIITCEERCQGSCTKGVKD